ncbi:MAG: tetratricopeptide repeat protein [Lachnospiraceae bacterium]|nr:tetratricopeptide repeat protein [Lachnospiraceae bacterium]
MSKKRVKIVSLLCCGLTVFLLTGCGSSENITQGMQHIKDLNYQAALESFDLAETAGENEKLIARGRGIAYMGLIQYEQAEQSFLEALQQSKGLIEDMDYDINLYLAATYTKEGKYSEAEDIYDAILALHPKDNDVLFLRGSVRLKLGDYTKAKSDMDQVVAKDSKNFERLIQIYEAMASAGYKEAGQEYLTNALQTYEAEMSNFDKGRMHFYLGEYQQAYIALEEAKSEGGVEAYLYLGMAYEATGDYNYAASVYNSYLTKESADARIYNQLGLCEMKKGEYANALAAFQSGLQAEGTEMLQSLQFNEIVAYEHLGEFTQAKSLMESYLTMYPDDEKATREYSFLLSR